MNVNGFMFSVSLLAFVTFLFVYDNVQFFYVELVEKYAVFFGCCFFFSSDVPVHLSPLMLE